jgi:undecaprenyl-diphosphatase
MRDSGIDRPSARGRKFETKPQYAGRVETKRMTRWSVWIAIAVGAIQGVVEWLPISSEGGVSIVLTAIGASPAVAVQLSLFLHAGTGFAALAYYRGEIGEILADLRTWDRHTDPFTPETETTTFVIVATVVSALVAGGAYLTLLEAATELAGGAFIAVIGGLLVLTGLVQWVAERSGDGGDRSLGLLDPVLVGAGQGLAVLPGVSRSGTTASVLLLRGHSGERSFRLSFLLSIPAAFGASLLAIVELGGVPTADPVIAAVAVLTSAVVGYATIDVLMRIVRRLPFWQVCFGLGGLAILGGGLLLV